ncbi:hypothetical protein PPERSA_01042 [Pseudocohnilembus persalinus]|uniref:Phosphate transporter n=1 Tax=Pseudocohnilembus persalinus TaxID=266149 RepID=A0A0V0QUD1_PSEPJ|nr:hypothetical protein PPERSA_01042 [Pseudocohnilembus persalinus]|eukprot:KRX05964.1 hypothetical protein PPERSA_01042 [Pseudocohnilembus persalinus]
MQQQNLKDLSNTGTFQKYKSKKIPSFGEYYPTNFTLIPNYDNYYVEQLNNANNVAFNSKINIDQSQKFAKQDGFQSPSTMTSTLSHFFQNSKKQAKNSNTQLTNINNRILTIKHKNQNLKTYNSILENKKNNLVKAKLTAAQMRQSIEDHKLNQVEKLEQRKREVKMQRQQYLENLQRRKQLKQMQVRAEQNFFSLIEQLKEQEREALLELQKEQQKQEQIEDEYELNLNSKINRWGNKSTRSFNKSSLFLTQSQQQQLSKNQKQLSSYNDVHGLEKSQEESIQDIIKDYLKNYLNIHIMEQFQVEENVQQDDQNKQNNNKRKIIQFIKENQNKIELFLAFSLILLVPVCIAPLFLQSYSDIEIIYTLSIPLTIFLGIAIGGNDICNSMGTSYGSNILTLKQVIILGVICESFGILTMGEQVAKTISSKVIDIKQFDNPDLFALTMAPVLGAAAFSSLAVTIYGLPVSITQGIIFSMVAVGFASVGVSGIKYESVIQIFIALVSSPLIGVLMAFLLYIFLLKIILKQQNPQYQAKIWAPYIGGINIFVIVYLVLFKGIKIQQDYSLLAGIIFCVIAIYILKYNSKNIENSLNTLLISKQNQEENNIGEHFKPLLIITACFVSFTHGSNDVGNAIGPLSSIYHIYQKKQSTEEIEIPFWTLILGAISFSLGIILIGKRTIHTFGKGVTNLNTMKGFTIQFGTSIALLVSSILGMPVSTSHCAVGSILGATLAEKFLGYQFMFNFKSLSKILASWIYTIPFVFFIAIYFYFALKGILFTD